MKRTWRKKILPVLSGMVTVMVLAFTVPAVGRAYVQTTGVITTDAAKVRKEPSTESDMLATVLKGSAVIVTDEVTDSAGMVWYKVSYMGGSGYIRSDLMSKMTAAGTTLTTTTQTGNANATTTAKPSATQVTAIAETKAYVNYKSVMVRQSASKQAEIVGSAVQNTPMTITGEAKAADGKKWYQVKYMNQNNREIVGFVRSDLLTVGDPPAPPVTDAPAETPAEAPAETSSETPAEQPEGGENAGGENTEGGEGAAEGTEGGEGQEIPEPAPEPEPEPEPEPVPAETATPDYEMVLETNEEGAGVWYLYDHINNNKQSLENLREWAAKGEAAVPMEKQLSVFKIALIAVGVLAAVLAVVVIVLLFRLRDMYEDDDEDDEDEEDEDEDEEDEDEEEERPVRRRRPAAGIEERPVKAAPAPRQRPAKEGERRPAPVKKADRAGKPERERPGRPDRTDRMEKMERMEDMEEMESGPSRDEFWEEPSAAEKPQPKRKPKNFLIEDDEFEFEFLNMDDKK